MSSSYDLTTSKKNLQDALGESMKIYLQLMMSWFKLKISRSDFDHEARKLLPSDSVHLHNHFLLAILAKCSSLGSSAVRESERTAQHTSPMKPKKPPSSRKRKPPISTKDTTIAYRNTFQYCYVPVNPLQQAMPVNVPAPEPDDKGLGFMSREMTLPDIGMVHGRLIVCAWDFGLENVEDNAVRVLMQALQVVLKNIISVTLSRRNAYKLRNNRFRYCMGFSGCQTSLLQIQHRDKTQPRDLVSISSKGNQIPMLKPSLEMAQETAAVLAAQDSTTPPPKLPVSLYDLLDALQVHKSAIPSHTVHATNMERLLHKLWHPSPEEHEQDVMHQRHTSLKLVT